MKNTSLKIKRLPYSRMLKSEMADYVEKTIEIVEQHDLESVMIDPMFNLLQAKEPDVKLLRLSYGIDTMRLKANDLKADMMLQISTFKLKVRLLNRSNLALDLHVLQNAINSHLTYLTNCKNDKQLNQKVGGFFDLVNSDVELSTVITDFGLFDDVALMTAAYNELNHVWKKRVELLSKRPAIDTKIIVKGMAATINDLFKGIEVAHLLSTLAVGEEADEQIDYAPLIDELHQLSEMYYRSISIRDANNKRKAAQDKERNPERTFMYGLTDAYAPFNEEDTADKEQTNAMKNTDEDNGSDTDEVVEVI